MGVLAPDCCSLLSPPPGRGLYPRGGLWEEGAQQLLGNRVLPSGHWASFQQGSEYGFPQACCCLQTKRLEGLHHLDGQHALSPARKTTSIRYGPPSCTCVSCWSSEKRVHTARDPGSPQPSAKSEMGRIPKERPDLFQPLKRGPWPGPLLPGSRHVLCPALLVLGGGGGCGSGGSQSLPRSVSPLHFAPSPGLH